MFSVNLGAVLAQREKRVILIDLDMGTEKHGHLSGHGKQSRIQHNGCESQGSAASKKP